MAHGEGGSRKRGTSLPFVILRLMLSAVIFGVLFMGLYAAYKQFSGVDPLKVNPKSVVENFLSVKSAVALVTQFVKGQKIDTNILGNKAENLVQSSQPDNSKKNISFSFVLVADSHNENAYLGKALTQAQRQLGDNLQFVIGLGDYTEVGTKKELEAAKKEFDATGIRYFVTAGDHDLWDGRDKLVDSSDSDEGKQQATLTTYKSVFGPSYQMFTHNNVVFLILNNADNYLGLGSEQKLWLSQSLEEIKSQHRGELVFAFMHEPLYHLSSNRIMGKVKEELKVEAKDLTLQLKRAGVREVFSGDIHFFTRYQEPASSLQMTTIGAVTSTRNAQSPRFVIVNVYDDGSYSVEDTEIK